MTAGIDLSCGTLVLDGARRLLLCHVTGTPRWDIPKGLRDPGETEIEAALRELREETGLVLEPGQLRDLGRFGYRRDKALHLFRAEIGDAMPTLDHLVCTSFFPHHRTGEPTPEADGFRWATREEAGRLCWPRMAALLLTLDW